MAKKKSLLVKVNDPSEAETRPATEGGLVRPPGALSVRQLIAKKVAAEKLLTAKRPR